MDWEKTIPFVAALNGFNTIAHLVMLNPHAFAGWVSSTAFAILYLLEKHEGDTSSK